MYRYQKNCWTLKECTDWYVQYMTGYAAKLKAKQVIPQIGALIGGDTFIAGYGPDHKDEVTKFIIGMAIRDRHLHYPASLVPRDGTTRTVIL